MTSCTVLIAAPELLDILKQRTGADDGELLAFSDADALRALEVIAERRPHVVALERLFAETPRGAALIHRIKADPQLRGAEIRVLAHDSDYVHVSPRGPADDDGDAIAGPILPLDQIGTRRAQRHVIDEFVEVLVDGNLASVVDLSTQGAQVVSATVLKPNQRVRVALSDDQGVLRLNASVAWASFEIPPNGGPRYRAGIEFLDADGEVLDAFAARHKPS